MKDLIERARVFATEAHGAINQRRKYTDAPYIEHPAAVAALVESVPHDGAMVAAAWLHDTVEDCGVAPGAILATFGEDVAALVMWLTDVSKPEDGPREVRKAIDRGHTALAPRRAKTIKLADLIDNAKTIVKYDPGFALVYLREKEELLRVLGDGDVSLWWRARGIVEVGLADLARGAHRAE